MKLGVVGGGQLGRMLAMAALPLGIKTIFLEPTEDCCAADVGKRIAAPYDDLAALQQLAQVSDAVTFEFENVPAPALQHLATLTTAWPPQEAFTAASDRIHEKQLLRSLGIATASFEPIDSQADLEAAVSRIGFPAVLKTRTLGYDGKGQLRLAMPEDLDDAFARLGSVPLILEGFVNFDCEVSSIGVRAKTGEMAFYPLTRNDHQQGILRRSEPLHDAKLQIEAERYLGDVMQKLRYVGVLTIEWFVDSGRLVANEMAPRVHNSGHWTIEGAECSQFENHVRAVMGLPLGPTEQRGFAAMYNILGQRPDKQALLKIPGVHWHDYNKSERPARKIGHISVTAATAALLSKRTAALEEVLAS